MRAWINIAIAAIVAPFAIPALAQHHDHGAAAASSATVSTAPTFTDGIVKRVDKAAGRITIAHEAIRNLDMPKMTMVFRVKEASWLEQIKEGERIRFAAENPNGVLTVVAYQAGK